MHKLKIKLALVLWMALGCSSPFRVVPLIESVNTPTKSLLQAISIVDKSTIWISGHNATVISSHDGGKNWELFQHPTGDSLQFRDVHGFGKNKAVLMSAGPGSQSRIFTLTGETLWEENFVMQDSLGFLNCIDFWDQKRGVAYGDSFDEYPYILQTMDGGKTWRRMLEHIPKAGKGEGGFAASGTCITTGENGQAWIATGAGGNARILYTNNYGNAWQTIPSPLVKGEVAGNTSISFTGKIGFLTGGDMMIEDNYTENCAFSADGGKTWTLTKHPQIKGAFYGGAITSYQDQIFAFACGPNGLDYTSNNGETWSTLDTLNYWAVSFHENIGFVSGKGGKVLKITLQE